MSSPLRGLPWLAYAYWLRSRKTYLSRKKISFLGRPLWNLTLPKFTEKPTVSSFVGSKVVFQDGSEMENIDTVILATGYQVNVPFLTRSGRLDIVPDGQQGDHHLTTNLRYIRPLYRQVFALDDELPPLRSEERIREAGFDPAYLGHRIISLPGDEESESGSKYQNDLIKILQDSDLGGIGPIPLPGRGFVERWRSSMTRYGFLLLATWRKIEEKGPEEVHKWVKGAETEQDWVDLMWRVIEWGKQNNPETAAELNAADYYDYY
jgi:hypothetical protein